MNKKVILILAIVFIIFILLAGLLLCMQGYSLNLSEEKVEMVEEYLATVGELDITFLKKDIDEGIIAQHIYDNPKAIIFLEGDVKDVLQWQVIKFAERYYILVYCGDCICTYDFTEELVEKL